MHHTWYLLVALGMVWAGAAMSVGLIAGKAIRLADEREAARAVAERRRWRVESQYG